jgi:sugar/nucleoside kinase (ribokinase family)
VVDPTGAGDCFAGGFMGYIATQLDKPQAAQAGEPGWRADANGASPDLDHQLLAQAMAYGTALASFNVESFGVERVISLTSEEIAERVTDLRRMTHFVERPVELRR